MNENAYRPRHFRIIRHVTKNRILDIQDCLHIGKLRIEIVEYAEGEGAKLSVEHFAEPDALALICYDILQGRPFDKYVEYKGTPQGEAAISRMLVIERVEARNPFKITVSRGPGKVTETGAIQPVGKPEASLSMLLPEFDARRIAYTILRHLAAFEAATYHARVAAGTRRADADPEQAAGAPEAQRAVEPAPSAKAAASRGPVPVGEAAPASKPAPVAEAASATAAPAVKSATAEVAPGALRVPSVPARPAPRRVRAVESYWMAAERIGVTREEAESILRGVDGDWGRAWSALRAIEQRQAQARN